MAKAWTAIYRGRHVVRWTKPDGKLGMQSCPSARLARELCEEVNRAILLRGAYEPPGAAPVLPGPPPVGELLSVAEAYLESCKRSLARRTVYNYAGYLDLLAAFLEASDPARTWRVSDLSRGLLERGWTWLLTASTGRHGRQRQPDTARKIIEVWTLLWRWSADHDEYGASTPPPRPLDMPSRPRPRPVVPTWGQARAMLDALDDAPAWTRRLVELAWYLGERREALLRLPWSAVDLGRRRLVVPDEITKGGTGGRVVPLHADLVARLQSWERAGELVLDAPALELTGRGHVDRTVRRAWHRAGVAEEVYAGQPIHALRGTLRTHLTARGVSGSLVDAYIGHVTPGTGSRHYTDRAQLVAPLRAVVKLIPAIADVTPDASGFETEAEEE